MIFERSWTAKAPKAAVVLVHGLAEHSGRYEHVARALNHARYSVFARDVRGHGRSVGFPGDVGGSHRQLIDDVLEQIRDVQLSHTKTYVYAHSGGTLIAVPAVGEHAVDGLICTGMAISPTEESLTSMATGDLDASAVSRDPEVVRAYVEDPLVFADAIPPETLAILLEAGPATVAAFGKIKCPVLLLHGGADRICDVDGSEIAYAELASADKQFKVYPGLFHEIHNEPEKDEVLGDVVRWLDERS